MIKLKSGDKYGKLTLLESTIKREKRKNNNGVNTTFWKCKCDCGNIKENIREDHIISGKSQSCGCNRGRHGPINPYTYKLTKEFLIEEYINKKKSVSSIASETHISKSWIEVKLKQFDIVKRTNKENGFPNKAKEASIKSLWKGYEEISGSYFGRIQKSAKDRGILFDITIKDIWNKFIEQNKKCALTDIEIYFYPKGCSRRDKYLKTASLDRIDSNKGYTKNNIQWLHKDINKMKWEFTQDKLIEYCRLIINKKDKKC